MSCTNPCLALDLGVYDGKHKIKFLSTSRVDFNLKWLEEKYGKDAILKLPCGKCESCLLTKRKIWSQRCMHEAKLYTHNCFITLTYNDENYDPFCKNRKRDLQLFFKRLRKYVDFRYFACGEVGDGGRFHYHAILFGYFPDDAKSIGKMSENPFYHSKFIDKIWSKGFVTVSDISPATCEYVAGYVDKKFADPLHQCFITMSNRPGIGADYYKENADSILKYQNIVGYNGAIDFVNRYCEKVLSNDFDFTDIKKDKLNSIRLKENDEMNKHGFENREELYFSKKDFMKDKLKRRKRKL